MRICIPEVRNPIMQAVVREFPEVEFVGTENLQQGCELLLRGEVDTMLSGLEYASRDVLLAYKAYIPLGSRYFSSSFICEKEDARLMIADGGVNKQPNKEQLYTIVEDSARVFERYYEEQPRIAMLSYSTYGSGGKNPDLEKIYFVRDEIRRQHPEWLIDGEMQLDAAVNPEVAQKKAPDSPLAGQANVLIVPELNTGNILYKALEQFGGWTVAGPIIQGFKMPLADLSRGSSEADVMLTIKVMQKLCERS